jgi:hypothetical protein
LLQNRVDYLGFSETFPIDAEAETVAATEEAKLALRFLKNDVGPGGKDRFNRVLVLWLTLMHRHARTSLGRQEYEKQLEEFDVFGRLWDAVRSAPRGHPRAALLADNLRTLCSFFKRPGTREAYVHLIVFDPAYRNPLHTVPTDKPTNEDLAHLRALLERKPLKEEEIKKCKRSLGW